MATAVSSDEEGASSGEGEGDGADHAEKEVEEEEEEEDEGSGNSDYDGSSSEYSGYSDGEEQSTGSWLSSLDLFDHTDDDDGDVITGNGGVEDGDAVDEAAVQAIVLSPGSPVQVMGCFHSHPAAASSAFLLRFEVVLTVGSFLLVSKHNQLSRRGKPRSCPTRQRRWPPKRVTWRVTW